MPGLMTCYFGQTKRLWILLRRYEVVVPIILVIFLPILILAGCGSQDDLPEVMEEIEEMEESLELQETATSVPTSLPTDIAATVNGEAIPVKALTERLHRAMQELDDPSALDQYTLTRLREDALTELIANTLIAQKARENNVTVSEEDMQQVIQRVQEEYGGTAIQEILAEQEKSYSSWLQSQQETLLREKVFDVEMASVVTVSPEEVRQYYERNKEKYDHPAQVRASQILTYQKAVAEQALQAIQQGEDFATVAQKYSESEDAQNGGDLGFFSRGVMPPEFDEVIFSLKMGEVSNIVKTPYGYQIFKLTGQREAQRIAFEDVQDHIADMIKQQKRMMAIDLWMLELQNNAKIVLNLPVIKQVK